MGGEDFAYLLLVLCSRQKCAATLCIPDRQLCGKWWVGGGKRTIQDNPLYKTAKRQETGLFYNFGEDIL